MNTVYGLVDWQWYAFGMWTMVAMVVSFYLPGWLTLQTLQIKQKSVAIYTLLALVTGLVLWTGQAFLFGYLHWRWLTYVYLALIVALSWKKRTQVQQHVRHLKTTLHPSQWSSGQRLVAGVIFFGLIIQMLPVFGSGLRYSDGVRFYRVNAYDGVLHLAYIQEMAQHFPPREPGAVQLPLINYHYWSDLTMAELARVWQIPIAHLFFQFLPVFISVLTGVAAYTIVRIWGGQRSTGLWSLFFLYGVGDTSYLLYWIIHDRWFFDSIAIDNGSTQFLNVPHTFAKLIFLTALIPVWYWVKTREISWGVLTILLLAPLVGFKVYYGMFVALGLYLIVMWWWLSSFFQAGGWRQMPGSLWTTWEKSRAASNLLIACAIVSGLIFFANNKDSGGLFYSPLEWPKLIMGQQNLDFIWWWLRRQVYEEAHSWKGLLATDVIAILVALISIYGTRMLGFLPTPSLYKKWGLGVSLFLIPGTLLFTWLGLFTLQRAGLFNVFNFLVVASIPLALASAWITDSWWRSRFWPLKLLVLLTVVLSVPKVLFFTHVYIETYRHNRAEQTVTNAELAAFDFIEKNTAPEAIFQSHPKNKWDRETPYMAFFANRPTYLTGVGLMDTHNQPNQPLKDRFEYAWGVANATELATELKSTGINYLYLTTDPEETLRFKLDTYALELVFENEAALVYQVK